MTRQAPTSSGVREHRTLSTSFRRGQPPASLATHSGCWAEVYPRETSHSWLPPYQPCGPGPIPPAPGRCPWYPAPSRARVAAPRLAPADPAGPPRARRTRSPPPPPLVPAPHAHREAQRGQEGRTPSARSAGAQPGPPRLQAATPGPEEPTGRQPGGGGGEARGRCPSHTLTWLLVVVAYYDEVVGQPGHGRRRRAGEAGARCRLRRRRPPGPGGLSIFPAAAVAAAAALQPCLTTEARSAPAPRLASAPPPPPPALAR